MNKFIQNVLEVYVFFYVIYEDFFEFFSVFGNIIRYIFMFEEVVFGVEVFVIIIDFYFVFFGF